MSKTGVHQPGYRFLSTIAFLGFLFPFPFLLLLFFFFFFSSSSFSLLPLLLLLFFSFSSSFGLSLSVLFSVLFRGFSQKPIFFYISFRSSRPVVAPPGCIAHWSNSTAFIASTPRGALVALVVAILTAQILFFSSRAAHRDLWSR
ncbi:hypothetical protein ACOSP7_010348 [Xanthoceras sorbifolium]